MSVSLKQSYDIEYNGTANVARMDLFVDTASDLTGLTTFDSITLLQGSTAEDISTGDVYMMKTDGTWIKQPSQSAFANVYTKAEIDNMFYLYYTKTEADALFEWITVTITTDTLPLTFISDGSPLTAWTISGNGQQSGTPTPDNPVMPEFVGVRTGNLLAANGTVTINNVSVTVTNGHFLIVGTTNSEISSTNTAWKALDFTLPAGTYRFKTDALIGVGFYIKNYETGAQLATRDTSFTLEAETHCYIAFYIYKNNSGEERDIMLNSGSTALPYEPFGYKIPITCAGQTVPVYLGQTQTVRRIKKLVLTSTTPDWTYDSTYNRYTFRIADSLIVGVRLTPAACSHFVSISDGRSIGDVPNNAIYSNAQQTQNNWFIKTTDYTTASSFKQFLDDELAAGHPVTVWYILATPSTEIINEPLAKIGDYADELSSTDAAVTIPTAKGSNTLTVGGDLQPSEITITGKIREVTENEQ